MLLRLAVFLASCALLAASDANAQAPEPTRRARVTVRDARTPQAARDEDYPPYKREAGILAVNSATAEWVDAARGRTIRVCAYISDDPNEAGSSPSVASSLHRSVAFSKSLPLIVLSTGLGATRDDYAFLAQHWAGHGLQTLVVEHELSVEPRSDRTPAILSVDESLSRRRELPLDLRFALDRALQDPAIAARVDPARIGVAGQGMGAFAALAVGGLMVDFGARGDRASKRGWVVASDVSFRDPRFRAVLAISPPPEGACGLDRAAWKAIATPVLHVVGTRDEDDAVRSWRDRLIGYEQCPQRDQFLVTIRNASYDSFYDLALTPRAGRKHDPRVHDGLRMASTAFWDAYLRDDAAAQRWLLDDTLEGASARTIRLDHKNTVALEP